ncbi:hypothetical protein HI914_07338 [Erysiphe necator]|nr:hypothetical protein HI914_07338 [Erysiphe necator]
MVKHQGEHRISIVRIFPKREAKTTKFLLWTSILGLTCTLADISRGKILPERSGVFIIED